LLGEIKQRIRAAQYEALKAVNKELILNTLPQELRGNPPFEG
jgi:hypothetical protein